MCLSDSSISITHENSQMATQDSGEERVIFAIGNENAMHLLYFFSSQALPLQLQDMAGIIKKILASFNNYEEACTML
jgi:hypothetical protein